MKKLILMAMFLILCNLGFSKTFFEVSFNDGTSANLREKASNNSKYWLNWRHLMEVKSLKKKETGIT